MAKEKKVAVDAPIPKKGLVVHCDGSARPNPGYAGYGIHGYIYHAVEPTKGTGNPDYVLTEGDYLTKTDKASQPNTPLVTPINYIDGYGGIQPSVMPPRNSNNEGELAGSIVALRLVVEQGVEKARVWTDSEYVVKGLTYVANWSKNNWLRPNGEPPANVGMWREFWSLYNQIKDSGVDFTLAWNRGHEALNFGNSVADERAFIGMRHATNGDYVPNLTLTPPEGYWKYEHGRHPFIMHRRMYYNTLHKDNLPGEYCLGEHDKDDDYAGKRMSNGAYAYIRLDEPDKVLETVRKHSCDLADGDNRVMIARLDYIYRADVHQMLSNYGHVPMVRNDPDLLTMSIQKRDELVTREHSPPLLIDRCVQELGQLKQILDDYLNGVPDMVTTDLTPLLYESIVETSKKGDKQITKLRPEFKVGTSDLAANVNYRHPDGSVRQADINLMLGLDLLDRNALRRLEEMEPEIRLVTWAEEPQAFRFATIIKVKGAVGILAGSYSNLRIVL